MQMDACLEPCSWICVRVEVRVIIIFVITCHVILDSPIPLPSDTGGTGSSKIKVCSVYQLYIVLYEGTVCVGRGRVEVLLHIELLRTNHSVSQ